MAVFLIITSPDKAAAMTRWGGQFARATNEPLTILRAKHGKEAIEADIIDAATEAEKIEKDPALVGIFEAIKELQEDPAPLPVIVKKMVFAHHRKAIFKEIQSESPNLLIIGKHESSRNESPEAALARHLFEEATCETMLLRPGDTTGELCVKILVPGSGGPHSQKALTLASKVAEASDGKFTPLLIESDFGEVAEELGLHQLERNLKSAGVSKENERATPKVILADNITRGIRSEVESGDYDLLLLGASGVGYVRSALFGTVPERLMKSGSGLAVAVIRRAKPVGDVIKRRIEQWLHFRVPQLEREDRVALFENFQTNARWSFDFMTLICLSTAIAALGLLADSAAVVIGAMLVAPLMTPLLGSGLALVQGNLPLMKSCARAIVYGFFSALTIGIIMGLITPGRELTSEMAARGGPTLLDMGVAFLSGVAASYCVARPRLSSALAGVAIAAALVPPIATTGISIALGELAVARGAALLFGTNVVAIILGAAINFYAAGIRGGKIGGGVPLWVKRTLLTLIVCAVALLVPLGSALVTRALETQAERPVLAEALIATLERAVNAEPGRRFISAKLTETRNGLGVEIQIAAAEAPPVQYANELSKLLEASSGEPTPVRIITLLEVESLAEP